MNTYLLYRNRDWKSPETYFDYGSIVQDLSLHILFRMASRAVIYERDEVKGITETDPFLQETMKRVMGVSLETYAEIAYRQEILKDCLNHEQFARELYSELTDILREWAHLGRQERKRTGSRNPVGDLMMDIQVLRLFLKGLARIRTLFEEAADLRSEGLCTLRDRLREQFPEETEQHYRTIADQIAFYISDRGDDEDRYPGEKLTVELPRIVFGVQAGDGMKLEGFVLQQVETQTKKYRDPNSAISKVQGFLQNRNGNVIPLSADSPVREQTSALEFEVVRYVMSFCEPFLKFYDDFFDQLHLQMGFYVGAVNLVHHMKRLGLEHCFPTVCTQNTLRFADLKEFVMCIEQRVNAVGNTCDIEEKSLLIVTGANQGGKSTFLRSIGIAQVCMQCGLPVTAASYASGIFPSFFTHFTRREDSAMNSGRLDEELGRMNQIIEHLGERSIILLNESFATTTEKEGSVIAYDIIKALQEAGVKILTVTHLLSFAKKVYEETKQTEAAGENPKTTFLSAQRLENGRRTFKMIQHEPELTSFGLDLYESIIVNKNEDSKRR